MADISQIGILTPVLWEDGHNSGKSLLKFFQKADELGFGSIWVPDRLISNGPAFPSPLVLLSMAAAVTKRVMLGTSVLIASIRHPLEIAQHAASLDSLSDGRFILGLGMGGRDNEFTSMGISQSDRLGRFLESVSLYKSLLNEQGKVIPGKHFAVEPFTLYPKPKSSIPILFGARADKALIRTGQLSDGWIQGGAGTDKEFLINWQKVMQACYETGRDPSDLLNGKLIYVNTGKDIRREIAEVETQLHRYYGDALGKEQVFAIGSAEEIANKIRLYKNAGLQIPMLGLPQPDVEKLCFIAEEVVPLI